MNTRTKALTTLIALASSTALFSNAFAAGSTQAVTTPQTAAPVVPAVQAQASQAQGRPMTPAARVAGQPGPVCAPAPHPMKNQGRKDAAPRPGAVPVAPGNTAAPRTPGATTPGNMTPDAMKNAPARPAADGKAPANCGPHRRGTGHPGGGGRGGERPAAASQGQRGQVSDATRTQNALTRIDALLTKTTDARARSYLTDARTLAQSGNGRAAQSLIRAAQAISNTQK